MKITRTICLAAISLLAGWTAATIRRQPEPSARDAASDHTGVSVEQIRPLASLVTAKVDVSDVVETRVDGWTGGMRMALLVKGDVSVAVDLARARFEVIDEATRTATLILPQPTVTDPRLDHERTRVFAIVQSGVWQVTPGGAQLSAELANRAYRDAQRLVGDACRDATLLEQSRERTRSLLTGFFQATGWTVEVRWER